VHELFERGGLSLGPRSEIVVGIDEFGKSLFLNFERTLNDRFTSLPAKRIVLVVVFSM
jgi:hypothetical protein